MTRQEVDNALSQILKPEVDIADHLQANQLMLDYLDQEIETVSGSTWNTEK